MREGVGSAFALLDEQGRVLARSERLEQLQGEEASGRERIDEALRAAAQPGAQAVQVTLGGRPVEIHAERAGCYLLARLEPAESLGSLDDERLRTFALLAEGMAHETRNPLNTLSIHLGLLGGRLSAADPTLGERLERHVRAMREAIKRVESTLSLFMQFLSPPRAAGGPLDLAQLVGQAVEAFGHEARRQGVTVETELEAVRVDADGPALGEAVLQLVGEGIAAGGAGSRLEVRVERSGAEALLALRELPADSSGCPEPVAAGAAAERTLPFAERIVELHRGNLQKRREGSGREVEVRLPLARR